MCKLIIKSLDKKKGLKVFVLEPLFQLELKEATQPAAPKRAAYVQCLNYDHKVKFGKKLCCEKQVKLLVLEQ